LGRRLKQEAYFGEEVKAGGLFWGGGQSRRLILGRRSKQEAYFGQEVKAGGLFWAGGQSRRLILGRRLKFSDKNSLTCHSYGG